MTIINLYISQAWSNALIAEQAVLYAHQISPRAPLHGAATWNDDENTHFVLK